MVSNNRKGKLMEKVDLQLVLKRYFEEHQAEALDGVLKLATDV